MAALLIDPRHSIFLHSFCSIVYAMYSYITIGLAYRLLFFTDRANALVRYTSLVLLGSQQLVAVLYGDWYSVPATMVQYYGFLPTFVIMFQI